jgi:hypothetical protein
VEVRKTEVVAQGWALRTYGTKVLIARADSDKLGSQDLYARHTVAVTSEGQLLGALVLGDTVHVAGAVPGQRYGYSSPEARRVRLGPLVGSPTVAEALNEQFPELGPIVGFGEVQLPNYYRKDPLYDPSFDFRSVHLQKLAEAMVRTLQDLGVR